MKAFHANRFVTQLEYLVTFETVIRIAGITISSRKRLDDVRVIFLIAFLIVVGVG